jgi:D-arabinose 1-dehydrogenase-like Zn-dependent alcohol dehydrogenase
MQSAVLVEPKRLEIHDIAEPAEPLAHEAVIAVPRVGVWCTDFHAYHDEQTSGWP